MMAKISQTETGISIAPKLILEAAQEFVLNLFNEKNDTRLVYHNYFLTANVVKEVEIIACEDGASEDLLEAAQLGAWFHNVGMLFDYQDPAKKCIELAGQFLQKQNYPVEKQELVLKAIEDFYQNQVGNNETSTLLNDAVNACHYTAKFFEINPLLRLEKELMLKQQYSKADWAHCQLPLLLNAKFFTSFAKLTYEPIVAQNILAQKALVEKSKNAPFDLRENDAMRKFQKLERKLPSAGTQTFFRTSYRNHINLSSIADNKANIMISVNAILISVMISILSYRNITESKPMVLLPMVVFLITGLSSLIFAVLASRPKVTSLNDKDKPLEEVKKNIVFFGNFVTLDLEKYEAAMDAMMRDGELLYGNLTRDLYHLGKVLNKKYWFLTISYNIFMVGFVTTVLTFLIALLT